MWVEDFQKSKPGSKADCMNYTDYESIISELVKNQVILSMKQFTQHSNITCLEHSIRVSYCSYRVCKYFGLDYQSAARGGLLHDFFLYDWHVKNQRKGLHGFTHPRVALENAIEHFDLNDTEKDIIEKHMWPLTIRLPKTKESLVVSLVDKYCSLLEIAKIQRKLRFLDLTY
jgi:uncharacterized protein